MPKENLPLLLPDKKVTISLPIRRIGQGPHFAISRKMGTRNAGVRPEHRVGAIRQNGSGSLSAAARPRLDGSEPFSYLLLALTR